MPDGFTAHGVFKRFDQWIRHPLCSVSANELRRRIDSGWAPEKALATPPEADKEDRRQKADRLSKDFSERLDSFHRRMDNSGPREFKRHSPFIGVSRRKDGTFYAQIKLESRVIYLGQYPTEIEAALAYDVEAKKHGKSRLNFG